MPPEVQLHPQLEGWILQLQNKLSENRLLFAIQKFTAELIITRYKKKVNYGFSFTKWDFHLQNGNLGYKKRLSITKCEFSPYKRESRTTIYRGRGRGKGPFFA